MLLRLIFDLFRRAPRAVDPAAPAPRGTAVADDGTRRPTVSLRVDAAGSGSPEVTIEAHRELRSCALLHSHYVPGVAPQALFEMHLKYGRMFEDEVPPAERELHRVVPEPHRRLRVGYVSPNFAEHSVAYYSEPVIASHDRSAFEVYCYHTSGFGDETTQRFAAAADVWRDVHALSDSALARVIADDRIDILFDLAGHTLDGRLGVFARRPAPIQITWLGYPDTTGLTAMDYRITDQIADPPPEADTRHTERLLRLPGAFLCWKPSPAAPAVAPRDSAAGEVVFCSFNGLHKLNDRVIALWSRVLQRVPRSRLLMKAGLLTQPEIAERIRRDFAAHGIEPERLDLEGFTDDAAALLACYGRADVALDTWPYNSPTAVCEATWMGVPVVTLAGEAHMSRVAASLLTAAGLGELVAATADEFVDIAVSLARDAPHRRALRAALRPRMAASPLLDHAGFTRTLEAALRAAWVEWCGTAAPRQ